MPSEPQETGHLLRRRLTRAGLWAALPYVVFGALLVVAVVLLGRELTHHVAAIEAWIARLGPWGPVAFVVLYVLATSLLVPDTIFCILAGALFGMVWGAAAVVVGALLAAALQFLLSRRLLQERIQRTLAAKPSLAAIQRAVVHDQFRLQVLLRLTPLNPATISYLLGSAGVRFRGFLIACLALVPNLVVEVYFGHAGKHLAQAAAGGGHATRLHTLVLAGGLVVCLLVMVVVARMARRALTQAVAEGGGAAA